MDREQLKQDTLNAAQTALGVLVFKLKVLLVVGAVALVLMGVLKLMGVDG